MYSRASTRKFQPAVNERINSVSPNASGSALIGSTTYGDLAHRRFGFMWRRSWHSYQFPGDGPGFGEEPTGWAVGVERRHRHEDFGALFNGLVP
jgi:hypothetical protein